MPAALMASSVLAAMKWCLGIGTTFLFSQTLSPKTPCEAQLSVDFGSGKTLGLTQIQSRAARRGNIDHRPIHALLHRDKVNKGRHVMILVHALHGLACRSQVALDINNVIVITLFCIFTMIFLLNGGADRRRRKACFPPAIRSNRLLAA